MANKRIHSCDICRIVFPREELYRGYLKSEAVSAQVADDKQHDSQRNVPKGKVSIPIEVCPGCCEAFRSAKS